jgi:hypothetical protein
MINRQIKEYLLFLVQTMLIAKGSIPITRGLTALQLHKHAWV